jgi:hypothetical protein
LTQKASAGIDLIYQHCKGFQIEKGAAYQTEFLLKHIHKNAAWYQGHPGRSRQRIQQENELRNALQTSIDSQPNLGKGKTAHEIREKVLHPIRQNPDFQWAHKHKGETFLQKWGIPLLAAGVLVGLALVVLGFLFFPWITAGLLLAKVATISIWFLLLHAHERKDAAHFVPPPRDSSKVNDLLMREDFKVQNQITHLVHIKPGAFRQATLRFILGAIQLLAWTVFNKGKLGGIPSIHFARWVVLDGGKRLLFFSNFDGSWESYLGDFVDKASIGLTGVWSNTEGFPPTHNLIKAGARNEENFKAWTRQKQIETQIWYSAYMELSVLNINHSTQIRKGVARNMNEKEASEWLKKL